MSTGSILLGLALLMLVLLFVGRPFLQRTSVTPRPRTDGQRLLAQKEAMLAEIMALDFDYETGKLPEEVYHPQRAAMVAETATILAQLDTLPEMTAMDADIEAAIAQLRGQATAVPVAAPVAAAPVAAPTAVVSAVPTSGNGHNRFCTQCGAAIDPGDKFCALCGHKLNNRLEAETGHVPEKSVER